MIGSRPGPEARARSVLQARADAHPATPSGVATQRGRMAEAASRGVQARRPRSRPGRVPYLVHIVLSLVWLAMVVAGSPYCLPVHATASGKLFLAYLPEEQLSDILSQPLRAFTEKTVTAPEELRNQLEEIRRQGYALDYGEFEHGDCAIAAPIFNRGGKVIAAIGGPSPMSRMTPDRIAQIAEAFKEAAKGVSQRMGYRS